MDVIELQIPDMYVTESEHSEEEIDYEQFQEVKLEHECHFCGLTFRISKLLFEHQASEHNDQKVSDLIKCLTETELYYSSDSDADYTITVEVLKTPKTKDEYLQALELANQHQESIRNIRHDSDKHSSAPTIEAKEYMVGYEHSDGKIDQIIDECKDYDRVACTICNTTFTTPKILKQHIKLYHVKESGYIELDMANMTTYTCPECLRELKDARCLKKHMKLCHNLVVHSTTRRAPPPRIPSKEPIIVRGALCDKFPIIRDRSPVSGKARTKCGICGHGPVYGYTTILKHQIRRHGRPKKESNEVFICDFCSKEFGSKENLSRHIKIHENARRYACDECPAKFNTALLLTRHKRLHVYIKCGHCDLEFQFRSQYKAHHRAEHPKLPKNVQMIQQGKDNEIIITNEVPKINNDEFMEVCMNCNKVFRSKRGYKEHQCKGLDGLGNSNGEIFCPARECNFVTDDPTHFYEHKVVEHSGIISESPTAADSKKQDLESCTICQKQFKSRKGFLNHRCRAVRHVICPLGNCGLKFDNFRDYYEHVELVHQGSVEAKNPVILFPVDETGEIMQIHDVGVVESEIIIS